MPARWVRGLCRQSLRRIPKCWVDDRRSDRPMYHPMLGNHPSIAEVAALIGSTARANVLMALLDGHALTAGELAYVAGVSAQTTSGHLAKLTEAQLLTLTKRG